MARVMRSAALLAASSALAVAGIAAPAALAKKKHWSGKKCDQKAEQWRHENPHPTARERLQENELLHKHGCSVDV